MLSPLPSFLLLSLPLLSLADSLPLRTSMTSPPPLNPAEAKAKGLGYITSQAKVSPAELAPLWSALPPITVAKVLGTCHGGLFTGKPANGTAVQRDPINWWGKQ